MGFREGGGGAGPGFAVLIGGPRITGRGSVLYYKKIKEDKGRIQLSVLGPSLGFQGLK